MMKKNLHRTALLLSIGLPYGMHAGKGGKTKRVNMWSA